MQKMSFYGHKKIYFSTNVRVIMQKRCLVYIRVSTNRQAEEGYSIPQQTERLTKYCDAMDWKIVDIFVDDDTGKDMNRPEFQRMMQAIRDGQGDIVLVDKLDRLSRSQYDTVYLIQDFFVQHNISFVSRAEAFDTYTPIGKAMAGILSVFAELERNRIKERMADGKEGRAKDGLPNGGGHSPIGYDYKDGVYVVNEYEAMQVKELFELLAERKSYEEIKNIFNAKGYKHKYGKWSRNTVTNVPKNVVYIGLIKFKDIISQGIHQPIIDKDLFDQVQIVINERRRNNPRVKYGVHWSSPLGGMLFCKQCGGRYHHRTNGANKDGTKRSYYICYSRENVDKSMVKGECKNRTYRDRDLDNIVFEEIRELARSREYVESLVKVDETESKKATIQKRISGIDAQINKLVDLYSLSGIDGNMLKDKIKTLQDEKESLLKESLKIKAPRLTIERIQELAASLDTVKGDMDNLHKLMEELIASIDIDGDTITINWNF